MEDQDAGAKGFDVPGKCFDPFEGGFLRIRAVDELHSPLCIALPEDIGISA
jgi:hypothetical protein